LGVIKKMIRGIRKNKKGYFFSVDAFIALLIILGVVLFIKPSQKNLNFESSVDEDLINVLSNLKIGDIDNPYVKGLIFSGNITNLNNSVLDQIGEFYATSSSLAPMLAQNVLDSISLQENAALYFDSQLLASTHSPDYSNSSRIFTSRQVISGISNLSGGAKGYSSRAYLFSKNFVHYFYFGGYIGDGNISATIYRSLNQGIVGASVEGVFSNNFSLLINNQFVSSYAPTLNVPYKIDLSPYLSYLNNASIFYNTLTFFSSNGSNLYIGGGYIKIAYNQSFTNAGDITYIPGIEGLINIYSGFYIPGTLSALNVYLKYNSSYNIFMTIGNKEIYRGNSSGIPTAVYIDNVNLSTLLNYSNLSMKTIPYRIGLENVSYAFNNTVSADVISVSDLSGSMGSNAICGSSCNTITCNNCLAGCPICLAKSANRALIDGILNSTENRVGLVGYEDTARVPDYHNLSNSTSSLQSVVNNTWDAPSLQGNTCICCGINKAVHEFLGKRIIAYYNFDGFLTAPATDKTGYSHFADFLQGASYGPGYNDSGVVFDGNNDYMDARYVAEVTEPGTLSFWFKLKNPFNNTVNKTQGLWSRMLDTNNNAFIALKGRPTTDINNTPGSRGSIQAKIEGPYQSGTHNTIFVSTTTNSWQKDVWYHVALTWDRDYVRIYVNGFLEGSTAGNAGIGYTGGRNYFGRSEFESDHMNSPRNRFLNGSMDEIRFYNYALNQTEIQKLTINASVCRNNFTEVGEVCDGNVRGCGVSGKLGKQSCNNYCNGFDVCVQEAKERYKVLVVMSDGEANRVCPEQGSGNDDTDAIRAACGAYNNYSIKTYAVGFGASAGRPTLESIASCGQTTYISADVSNIIDIYKNISLTVIQAAYNEQTIVSEGNFTTTLYPDSFIIANYNYSVPPGLLITSETPVFNNNISQGRFYIPTNTQFYSARVVSYSGSKWTSTVEVWNDTGAYSKVFDLSYYNSNFTGLGDPYVVDIPKSSVGYGNNTVVVKLGLSSSQPYNGSAEDKIIYTLVKNVSAYSPIVWSAEGCVWDVEFEDSTTSLIKAPSNYTGPDRCSYNSSVSGGPYPHVIFNPNDAIDYSVYFLLKAIDLDEDGKIDTKITEQDLAIGSNVVSDIPFTWETEVQSRVWY
jgi:hypothetical protein